MPKIAELSTLELQLRASAPSIYITHANKKIAGLTSDLQTLRGRYQVAEEKHNLTDVISIKEEAEYIKAMIELYKEEIIL